MSLSLSIFLKYCCISLPFCIPSAFFFFFRLFYNWRIIALLCGVGFCCTTTQISHNYIYIYIYISPPSWRRQWHPTPVLLPGKSHGRRSLVGYSPWGHEESDTTKRLPFHFSLSCFGEGNGNPLQCSCLENPRDSGAWWAAVYGVAQNRTRLK